MSSSLSGDGSAAEGAKEADEDEFPEEHDNDPGGKKRHRKKRHQRAHTVKEPMVKSAKNSGAKNDDKVPQNIDGIRGGGSEE